MLPNITAQLRDALVLRKVPYPVRYGPLPQQPSATSESQIVVERDREAGDDVAATRTHKRNPKIVYARTIGAKVRIYARSSVAGADQGNHERLADQLVDHVLIALREIIVARGNHFEPGTSKLLTAGQLAEEELQTWPGVVYELAFTFDRGVRDAEWAGEAEEGTAATEATAGGDTGFGVVVGSPDVSDSPGFDEGLPGATTR